jgi:hypothetical protein
VILLEIFLDPGYSIIRTRSGDIRIKLSRHVHKKVEVEIVGGLGNQLFIFFAAYSHSINFSKELVLNCSEISSAESQHYSNIDSFEFVRGFQVLTTHKKNKTKNIIEAICRRNRLLSLVLFKLTGVFYPKGLGYDSSLYRYRNIRRICGYYQSFKYLENLMNQNQFLNLSLCQKSEWFNELFDEISTRQIIVVHVRRKDYYSVKDTIGLLSREYYEGAISYLETILPQSDIWVFSDDISEAKELLGGISSAKISWMEPPNNSDPAESLVLMSYGEGIIMANSSFSWWAAATGNVAKKVVAPSPWFKHLDEPELLIPNNWYLVPSNWQ